MSTDLYLFASFAFGLTSIALVGLGIWRGFQDSRAAKVVINKHRAQKLTDEDWAQLSNFMHLDRCPDCGHCGYHAFQDVSARYFRADVKRLGVVERTCNICGFRWLQH